MSDIERLHSSLRSAHEKLCIAQVCLADRAVGRNALGKALSLIEQVGVLWCPDWSSYRLPTTELDDPS